MAGGIIGPYHRVLLSRRETCIYTLTLHIKNKLIACEYAIDSETDPQYELNVSESYLYPF